MSWKSIEKQVQAVNDQRNKKHELEQKLSALDQFTTNRVLWANALNALQHTPVDAVQLVRIRTEQTFALNESATSRPNDAGGASGKHATVTERIVVNLEGRDFLGGDHVPMFKQSIATNSYFQAHLQNANKVQLTSLSAPQTDMMNRSFRTFGLQLFFEEKERHLYE
jgi:hypothetical protein